MSIGEHCFDSATGHGNAPYTAPRKCLLSNYSATAWVLSEQFVLVCGCGRSVSGTALSKGSRARRLMTITRIAGSGTSHCIGQFRRVGAASAEILFSFKYYFLCKISDSKGNVPVFWSDLSISKFHTSGDADEFADVKFKTAAFANVGVLFI